MQPNPTTVLKTLLALARQLPPTSALSSSLHINSVLLLVTAKAVAHMLHLRYRLVTTTPVKGRDLKRRREGMCVSPGQAVHQLNSQN